MTHWLQLAYNILLEFELGKKILTIVQVTDDWILMVIQITVWIQKLFRRMFSMLHYLTNCLVENCEKRYIYVIRPLFCRVYIDAINTFQSCFEVAIHDHSCTPEATYEHIEAVKKLEMFYTDTCANRNFGG